MTFDPNTLRHGSSLTYGLKLIGEALIDGLRGLGSHNVETPWSRLRNRNSECCEGCQWANCGRWAARL